MEKEPAKQDKRIIRMFFVEKMNTAQIARAIKRSEADVDRELARYFNYRQRFWVK